MSEGSFYSEKKVGQIGGIKKNCEKIEKIEFLVFATLSIIHRFSWIAIFSQNKFYFPNFFLNFSN